MVVTFSIDAYQQEYVKDHLKYYKTWGHTCVLIGSPYFNPEIPPIDRKVWEESSGFKFIGCDTFEEVEAALKEMKPYIHYDTNSEGAKIARKLNINLFYISPAK